MGERSNKALPVAEVFLGALSVLLLAAAIFGYFGDQEELITAGLIVAGSILAATAAFARRIQGVLKISKDGAEIPIGEYQAQRGQIVPAPMNLPSAIEPPARTAEDGPPDIDTYASFGGDGVSFWDDGPQEADADSDDTALRSMPEDDAYRAIDTPSVLRDILDTVRDEPDPPTTVVRSRPLGSEQYHAFRASDQGPSSRVYLTAQAYEQFRQLDVRPYLAVTKALSDIGSVADPSFVASAEAGGRAYSRHQIPDYGIDLVYRNIDKISPDEPDRFVIIAIEMTK
jgi:hypothetical protein